VVKARDADWADLKRPVADAIRSSLAQFSHPLGQGGGLATEPRDDLEIRAAVQAVLDRQANPAIASHGGHVAVTEVQGGVVSLLMSGGCQGCAASAATLRDGVEKMIRAAVPEVIKIVDVTNHSAGVAPFYGPGSGAGPDGASAVGRPLLHRVVPPDAIAQEDGQFMISPDYLAPKLGMDGQSLRAALRSGEVVSHAEAGEGADAGKIRLVVRSGQRAWAAEIGPDGTAHEIPPPRAVAAAAKAGASLQRKIRAFLVARYREDMPVTYGQLARAMGLDRPGAIAQITQAMEATMTEDARAARPFLAALVVSRAEGGTPGRGFFDHARSLGRGPALGEDDRAFHEREFRGASAGLKSRP
ncbi:MAG: DUF6522 family protein, partial [Paracoccaceae bacterium]|nr:DUF6522 family protein [Paracoccaceae bacterium]